MNITKTYIPDLLIIEPKVFEDDRGYLFESYNKEKYKESGIHFNFVQDNQSKSTYGVLRGLHYQLAPYSQTKLVRVLQGEILDIAVDIRKNSPTYGKWIKVLLSDQNKKQLLIPKGFAHGFSVLSQNAVVFYKSDEPYNPSSERGIIFNDIKLNIDWGIPLDVAIISSKDKGLPSFENAEMNFVYQET